MPEIGMNTLDCKSIAFIVYISYMMRSVIIHIQIANIAIRTIFFSWRGMVYNVLNSNCRFI